MRFLSNFSNFLLPNGRVAHMSYFLFSLLFVSTYLFDTTNGEYDCEYKKDGFYSDTDFCHIYWRCNYGVPEEYECPAGTAWNHKESRCDWLDNVDCSRIDEDKMNEDRKEQNKSYEDEDDDYEEYETVTKKPIETTEPAPEKEPENKPEIIENYDDNEDQKQAVATTAGNSPANAGDASSSGSGACTQSLGSYFVPDPTNCASYVMCNNGKETKMNCADKQLFNVDTQQCEEFQQVFCGSRPVNLADRNQCTSKRDGIFPDLERSCRVFYQCINQQKVREANCPNQLKFNLMTGRCDKSENIMAPCGTYSPSSSSRITTYQGSTLALSLVTMLITKLFAF